METHNIKIIKPIVRKTANQNDSDFSKKEGGYVPTETDLQFTKICLSSFNVQKFSKIIFEVSSAISCPLKALDRFT